MTVETEISRSGPYAGAGTVGPFLVDFRILDATHLRVVKLAGGIEVTLAYPADYLVTGVGGPTCSLQTTVAVAVGETLTIIRDVPKTQEADYVQNDDFPAETHENALDKLTMIVQQLAEEQDRALTLPVSASTGVSTELPVPQANAIIGWNSDADRLQNVDPSTLATIVAFGTTNADLFSGTGAQTVFTLTANPGIQANLDVAIGGVTQRPGIDYTWSAGTTLTFATAPPAGTDNILARYQQGLPQGYSPDLSDTSDVAKGDALIGVKRTETGSVGRTLHFWVQRSVYPFKSICDPTTDTAAQVSDKFDQAVINARTSGKILEFEPGATYTGNRTFKFLNVDGTKDAHFWGNGCTLRNTGAGNVAELMSATLAGRNSSVEFTDFILQGNAASTYGLLARGLGMAGRVHRVRVRDVATAGFLIQWAVCVNFQDLYLSGAIDSGAWVVNPTTGLILDQAGAGNYTAACTFINTVMENPITSTGIDLLYSGLSNKFIGGTCESIPRGVRQRSTARDTVFENFDFEGNTDFDIFVEGQQLVLQDINSGSSSPAQGNILVAASSSGLTVRGGYLRQIDLDPASKGTVFEGVDFDDNPAIGITNTGPWSGTGNSYVTTSVVGSKTFTSWVKDRQGAQNLALPLAATQGVTLTPTLTSSKGRNVGAFTEIQATLTMGSAGTAGQPILVQLPVGYRAEAAAVSLPVGEWTFSNGGTSGLVTLTASGEIGFMVSGSTALLGAAVTAAVGNILRFSVRFPTL